MLHSGNFKYTSPKENLLIFSICSFGGQSYTSMINAPIYAASTIFYDVWMAPQAHSSKTSLHHNVQLNVQKHFFLFFGGGGVISFWFNSNINTYNYFFNSHSTPKESTQIGIPVLKELYSWRGVSPGKRYSLSLGCLCDSAFLVSWKIHFGCQHWQLWQHSRWQPSSCIGDNCYSLVTKYMQRFLGNIFATRCPSQLGFSPLVLELTTGDFLLCHQNIGSLCFYLNSFQLHIISEPTVDNLAFWEWC